LPRYPRCFFASGQYNRALQAIYEVINNESFSTAVEIFTFLDLIIVGNFVDDRLLTEISRGEQTLTNDGLPQYTIAYECVGGGTIDAIRLGKRYQADLFNCNIGGNFVSGQTLSASMLLGEIDSTTQIAEFSDINFLQSGDGSTYTVSNGKTKAKRLAGLYSSTFSFDIQGSFTNDKLYKVRSDANNTLNALENDYYITGSFLVEQTDEAGVMKVDANSGDINTFTVTISKDNVSAFKPEDWSLSNNYFLRCGLSEPVLVNNRLVCRDTQQ